jgi:DnaJ-class molecular chaperone
MSEPQTFRRGELVLCPSCKGKGVKREGVDWWLAIPSAGISLALPGDCSRCQGEGFVEAGDG